jgi:hypothetical protein
MEGGLPSAASLAFFDSLSKFLRANGGAIFGTRDQRTDETAAGYIAGGDRADGTLYCETDTGAVYQWRVSTVRMQRPTGEWVLVFGSAYQRTQSQLAALAAVLGAGDAGLLVEVTDYAHILRWDGAAWEWGPGETGGGFVAAFAIDPTGAGWQLCDGTTVAYLESDGTTTNYTTPDLIGAGAEAYLKLGDTVSGPNAATAPTFTGGSVDAAATGITATTSATGTTTTIQNGAGVNVTLPSQAHVHAVNVTDPTHTHTIGAGSVADDGEPRNMVLRPWFRR